MNNRPTNVRYIVLFGLCLAAGLAYVHRGCLSVVESTVREDLDVSKGDMGWCFSAFFWAYALFQIPTGLLVDRWGPRRSLLLFGVLGAMTMALSAMCIWTDAVTGFAILIVARLLMGIAQAGLFPASTRAMSTWIPVERRAFAGGGLQACMSLGGAIGAFTTARLLNVVSWQAIFAIYAIPGLIWSAWFFAWFRDRPEEHRSTNSSERELLHHAAIKSAVPAAHNWFIVLTSLPVALLCAQQFFRAASAAFWFTWCPTYLQNALQQSKESAGELTSIPIIGMMLGSVGGGIIADRIYRQTGSRRISRCGTAIIGSSAGVACFVLAFFAMTVNVYFGVVVLALAAFLAAWGSSRYTVAMDLGGKNLATVFGAMNMCGNFGRGLFPIVATNWVDWLGWDKLLFLVAGGYLFGLLLWLPLRPDPKPMTSEEADYEEPRTS